MRSLFGRTTTLVILVAGLCTAKGAHTAVLQQYERVFTTYPYSDPDPVPKMSRFYPYFRYDGYTDKGVQKKWKVVELSNDYLQVLILPEIGGKIWAAIEKSTGKSFIYFNPVVKFRDVSMRGPWTSGGIEANYGIMGHTPNCFSPVDYLARHNPDGSVSCIVGVLDLLTRTTWRLEISLRPDAACFSTRSFWHNSSAADQPCYTWMNVGIKAAGNLQLVSPGTHYIGHDGRAHAWPVNLENGRRIDFYEQNNFGSYKSYHVLGSFAEFFGGYWHGEDFGMAHFAPFGEKPGRKFWIWGLSREGMIWEDLLTDGGGQYVEVQSGRSFNQADDSSSHTPFKHRQLAPYETDTWTEHWLPVKGIGGFVSASPWGAMNVTNDGSRLVVLISPARAFCGNLEIFNGERLIASREVSLRPMHPIRETVPLPEPQGALRVCLGGDKLQYAAGDAQVLSRPLEPASKFDWNSAYGVYLKGKESVRQRAYSSAARQFETCLKHDANFLPALVELAGLANRKADFQAAADFARRALGIDTYDPGANYQFGIANAALGRRPDASAAFGLAAQTPGWRAAACIELAKNYLRDKRYDRALLSAGESLDANARNADAYQLQACVFRLQGQHPEAKRLLVRLLELDPLNHFAHFEKYLQGTSKPEQFTGMIRNELPAESFLELASWYRSVGLDTDAAKVLDLAPSSAETLYWLAYLRRDAGLLSRAESASPAFVFPFRAEAASVFEWARKHSNAWQPKYFLALIRWHQGDLAQACELLTGCGNEPRFAPFYAARADLIGANLVSDLKTAAQLDPGQWRYGAMLAKHYLEQSDAVAALGLTAEYSRQFPENSTLAVLHAKAMVRSGRLEEAAKLLSSVRLLPSEGATEARSLFQEANLTLAIDRLKAKEFSEARQFARTAREWPENLGSGKPYPEDLDERLENWIEYWCSLKVRDSSRVQEALKRILASRADRRGSRDLLTALALKELGRSTEGEKFLKQRGEEAQEAWTQWVLAFLRGKEDPVPPPGSDLVTRVLSACFTP
jgi:tetratricopeptide (TPR) repeat protein